MSMKEATDENQQDILAFINWHRNRDLARKEVECSTTLQLAFWDELLLSKPVSVSLVFRYHN